LFCELLHENVPADVALYFLKFSSAMSLFVQLTGKNPNLKSKTTLHRARKYGIIAKTFGGIPMPIRHGLSKKKENVNERSMVDSEIDGLPTAIPQLAVALIVVSKRDIDLVESREGKFHETWDPNQI